jgi:predicted DNA-binding transcriptional regulator AlpA
MRELPTVGYLRLHDIIGRPATEDRPAIAALIPVCASTFWAGVRSGRYPQPTRALGRRITAWRVEDIRALIEAAAPEAAA